MKKILRVCALALSFIGLAPMMASAATINLTFTSNSPGIMNINAVGTTNGSNLLTGLTGLVNGTDVITGVVTTGTVLYTSSWNWDNILTNLGVTNGGILFTTVSGLVINLYSDAGSVFASFQPGNNLLNTGLNYNPGQRGVPSFVSAVPVPAAVLMLLSALAGLVGFGKLRRRSTPTLGIGHSAQMA